MPLRKIDSIFQRDTGRKAGIDTSDFILQRLRDFGKLPSHQTAHTEWLSETLNWLLVWNQKLPEPFDPWFLIAQTWHETGGYTSPYLVNDGNLAGIGIWASGIPSPWEGKLSPELAAQVYLLELMAHTYTTDQWSAFLLSNTGLAFGPAFNKDESHLTRVINLRKSVNWPTVRTIDQLNNKVGTSDNIWAADPQYDALIEKVAGEFAPNIPDSKGTTMGVTIGNRPLRIAIGAGHRNTSGGNSYEAALNAKCTNEIWRLAQLSRGFEIRSYTPENGLGYYPGPLDAAAAQVTTWLNEGWAADILHEVHHEGTGSNVIRGGFIIYPDSAGLVGRNPGNVDEDVKAMAGPMAQTLTREFNGVCRYPNCSRGMSEKETGVGEDGFRLGVFGAWAEPYFIANSFQFISEASTYTNNIDLEIQKQPSYAKDHAIGTLKMYAQLAKERGAWSYAYQIGGSATPLPPVTNAAPDGLPYPPGFDAGIMSIAFGALKDGDTTWRFSKTGTVSRKWYERFKKGLNWPRLNWHFVSSKDGREYFGFSNGDILWKPSKKESFRWA